MASAAGNRDMLGDMAATQRAVRRRRLSLVSARGGEKAVRSGVQIMQLMPARLQIMLYS